MIYDDIYKVLEIFIDDNDDNIKMPRSQDPAAVGQYEETFF